MDNEHKICPIDDEYGQYGLFADQLTVRLVVYLDNWGYKSKYEVMKDMALGKLRFGKNPKDRKPKTVRQAIGRKTWNHLLEWIEMDPPETSKKHIHRLREIGDDLDNARTHLRYTKSAISDVLDSLDHDRRYMKKPVIT